MIVRGLRGEPLRARELWAPLVLIGLGVRTLLGRGTASGANLAWTTAASALGLVLGAVRGRAIVAFERDGHLWQRYTGRTFLYVVSTFLAMAAYDPAAAVPGTAPDARPVRSALGVGFLGEAPAGGHRVLASGTPFAAERR
ncbi:hypothetical protein [Nocardiopsis sp. NPDC057823]|uniref:hypothetical protein n=1 Tax=Nocardiopsis sp. NPDC057823 TaxID=3346256 RepID=UPI003672C980